MLDQIIASVRAGLPDLQSRATELEASARAAGGLRSFEDALSGPGLGVIAEVKRRSPSRGVIDPDLRPDLLAKAYETGGAAAISVLTEPRFFDGSLEDLKMVKNGVGVPVLRKDFIVDEAQVWQARAAGADSTLLIVAILDDAQLVGLLAAARSVELEPLVEVHDEAEAERALVSGAHIIGVNNRDLATFDVDLATAERIAPLLTGVVKVAESGIWTAEDAGRMHDAGYDAVLVGESLVRSGDPTATIRSWTAQQSAM